MAGGWRMGESHQKDWTRIRELTLLDPGPKTGRWFNQWCLHKKSPLKTLNCRFGRTSGSMNMRKCWEVAHSGWGRAHRPLHSAFFISSIWLFPSCILYYEQVKKKNKQSVFPSSMNCLANYRIACHECHENLQSVVGQAEVYGSWPARLQLASEEWGRPMRMSPWPVGSVITLGS